MTSNNKESLDALFIIKRW